jgi:4-hydroxy-3-methylbut-2-en-1-yl diphosphate reductase
MKILTAASLGMCFGVRDALAIARHAPRPTHITVHGELVHNPLVAAELQQLGFTQASETGRAGVPATTQVLITAHGISDRERARLLMAGKDLIDTTCPLVRKAHAAARQLDQQGYHLLVVGKRTHVEVRGLTEDLRSFDVLETLADVRAFAFPRLAMIAQTTTLQADFVAFHAAVAHQNPRAEIRCVDTICQPTKDRQNALDQLLDAVELAVVVGGHHSNNTRHLVATCLDRGVPAYHVEDAGELRAEWFEGVETVGLTAGTSTLPETIAAVRGRLEEIAHRRQSQEQRVSRWRGAGAQKVASEEV